MVDSEENDKFDLRVIGLMIQENYDQSIGSMFTSVNPNINQLYESTGRV